MIVMTTNTRGYQYMPQTEPKKTVVLKKHTQANRSLKIKKLVNENPRKEGSFGWKSWNVIKEDMMIFEYLEAGGRIQDLMYDIRKGNIELYE